MPTAAIVVIGDEVLAGKVRDENTPFLASRLRALGVDLVGVWVVPDVEDRIASAVAHWSPQVDHVFTSGGVGPTHDDRTMAGVAAAFGVALERNTLVEDALRERMGDRVNDAALRMADIPQTAELWWDGELFFPQVRLRNVCIFPGVPRLLRMKFEAIAWRFIGIPVRSRDMTTAAAETEIAAQLTDAQRRWPDVAVGSYPQYTTRPWTVTVTLDSRNDDALDAADAWLRDQLAEKLLPTQG